MLSFHAGDGMTTSNKHYHCEKCDRYFFCLMGPFTTHQKWCGLDPAELFWMKVQKGADCWLWTGAKNEHGYGLAALFHDGRRRTYRAHRYSWEQVNGPVPEGYQVLHKCDVRNCVNPGHLFLGTNAVNMRDKALKGRAGTRLTLDQVREIRTALASGQRGINAQLARKYGVSPTLIHGIKRGRHYAYLP